MAIASSTTKSWTDGIFGSQPASAAAPASLSPAAGQPVQPESKPVAAVASPAPAVPSSSPLDPDAIALIESLHVLGLRLSAGSDSALKITGKLSQITDPIRAKIARLKPALIAVLTAPPIATWTVDRHVAPAGYDPVEWELVTWLTDLACSSELGRTDQIKSRDGVWFHVGATIRTLLGSLAVRDEFARLEAYSALRSFRETYTDPQGWRASSVAWPACFDVDKQSSGDAPLKLRVDTSKITIAPPRMRPIILVRGPGHCVHWYVDREPLPSWAREHRVGCCDGWEPIPVEWWGKYGAGSKGDAST